MSEVRTRRVARRRGAPRWMIALSQLLAAAGMVYVYLIVVTTGRVLP